MKSKTKRMPWQECQIPKPTDTSSFPPPPPPGPVGPPPPPYWEKTHTEIYSAIYSLDTVIRTSLDLIWAKLDELSKK